MKPRIRRPATWQVGCLATFFVLLNILLYLSNAQAQEFRRSFWATSVKWLSSGLRLEIETNLPEGTDVDVAISDENTGNNLISQSVYVTVHDGRIVAEGFANDNNDEPLHAGRYWLSITRAAEFLPILGTPVIEIPERPSGTATAQKGDSAARAEKPSNTSSPEDLSKVRQKWVDDILYIEAKSSLPDHTWLNVALEDENGSLVSDEGNLWVQVNGGKVIIEGFTKDGIDPIAPGRYFVSFMDKAMKVSLKLPIRVAERPVPTASRLAEVRAINVANVPRAQNDESAVTKIGEVPEFTRQESDMQLKHRAEQNAQKAMHSGKREPRSYGAFILKRSPIFDAKHVGLKLGIGGYIHPNNGFTSTALGFAYQAFIGPNKTADVMNPVKQQAEEAKLGAVVAKIEGSFSPMYKGPDTLPNFGRARQNRRFKLGEFSYAVYSF